MGKVVAMSGSAILLRVLLSVVLTLNGMGSAVASVQMAHAGKMAVEMPVSDAAEMPCHGHDDAQAEATQPDVVSTLAEEDPSQAEPDCCESGACRCACIHQAQAVVAVLLPIEAVIIHARAVLPPKAGHSAPALPHLIRPPIG